MTAARPFSSAGYSDALVILGAAGLVIPAFARLPDQPGDRVHPGRRAGRPVRARHASCRTFPGSITSPSPTRTAIEPFAEFGIVLLLFSIGLELSFKRLWSMRTLVFGLGAAELIVRAPDPRAALYLTGLSTGRRDRPRPRARRCPRLRWCCRSPARSRRWAAPPSRCCCSRIWRWCRSSSCLARWRPLPREAGWTNLATRRASGVHHRSRSCSSAGACCCRACSPRRRATKSPELFLAASLLVVIGRQPGDHRRRPLADRRRADRRAC